MWVAETTASADPSALAWYTPNMEHHSWFGLQSSAPAVASRSAAREAQQRARSNSPVLRLPTHESQWPHFPCSGNRRSSPQKPLEPPWTKIVERASLSRLLVISEGGQHHQEQRVLISWTRQPLTQCLCLSRIQLQSVYPCPGTDSVYTRPLVTQI